MTRLELNAVEARVLGVLVEKSMATPEYYPLSLNALVNGCNQQSNRDPVMQVDEEQAKLALRGLSDHGWAGTAPGAGQRVIKYEHRVHEALRWTRPQAAVMCELLLRGPQTPGELRARVQRLHPIDDLAQILSTLQTLIESDPPMVKMLARAPGTKESRYAHWMAGEPASVHGGEEASAPAAREVSVASGDGSRLSRLEETLALLEKRVIELRAELEALRSRGTGPES